MWTRLWAVARYDIGLSSEEFFSLTPRQFDALVKRREYEQEFQEFMMAQLTAYVINFSGQISKDNTVDAWDLMPTKRDQKKPVEKKKRVRITKKVQKQLTESFRVGLEALRKRNGG